MYEHDVLEVCIRVQKEERAQRIHNYSMFIFVLFFNYYMNSSHIIKVYINDFLEYFYLYLETKKQ